MTERVPELDRREIRLPDGRRLYYYPFHEEAEPGVSAPAPGSLPARPAPAAPPRREEP